MAGGKYYICKMDQKGRVQLPLKVREEAGIYGQVILEKEQNTLRLVPLSTVDDPIQFLSAINVKTKKTPVEMKREAEGVFGT